MTPMETGTRNAIAAMTTTAFQLSMDGEGIAALEVINGAQHILTQSPYIVGAAEAILADQLQKTYYHIKATWKETL